MERSGTKRLGFLGSHGEDDATNRAIAYGLRWLAKQQADDGSWKFDRNANDMSPLFGSEEMEDRIAATGMAILPFLAAGETHIFAKKYRQTVRNGLDYLSKQILVTGQFPNAGNFAQAVAAIPLCEVARMTGDPKYKRLAQAACDCIVQNQANDGSWGYNGKSPGNTFMLGWQIQAAHRRKTGRPEDSGRDFQEGREVLG